MAGWSIALSGGGHRASLFGLGAILYVTDARLNEQVTSIASVSGGSLTNGFIGTHLDYAGTDGGELRTRTKPLVRRCAVDGTVQWAPETILLLVGVVVGLALAVLPWFLFGGGWLATTLCVVGAVVALVLIELRSVVADRVLRRLLFTTSAGPAHLKDLHGPVTHVFCATEVQSNVHAYFSRAFAYSYLFGASTRAGNLNVSTAVQASACFPGGFPPRALSAAKLGFPSGARRRMWLVDGGVYDNMGDQWADGFAKRFHRVRELNGITGEPPADLLVVNASARSDGMPATFLMRLPIIGELLTLLREKSILYQVGTTSRRSSLVDQFDLVRVGRGLAPGPERDELLRIGGAGGTLVHIASTPTWTRDAHRFSPTEQQACERVTQKLSEFADQSWIDEARTRSLSVKTTLAKIGRDDAAALLWHGYVLAMTNLHVFYGTDLFEVPSKQDFESLID